MRRRRPYGAAAGGIAVALFLVAALLVGQRPGVDAPGSVVAAYLDQHRTRVQLGCAVFAVAAPFFVWWLATVASAAREAGPGAQRTGSVAYGCGVTFIALFMTDVTSLAVGALRPRNMLRAPELAVALRDVEFLLMGMAAFLVSALLVAFAAMALRYTAVWPPWLGRLAVIAAIAYALRVGTLFTTQGVFASDGVLGLYVPVIALTTWIVLASAVLVQRQSGDDAEA